jgi:prevent-host-death family protein
MREYSISQFKAHALAILKAIDETGEEVLVTKRGRPLARVTPCGAESDQVRPGHLATTVVAEGDLIATLVNGLEKDGRS